MAKLKVQYIALSDLREYGNNTRTHSAEQVAQIANSIREFGFTNPVLVDANNVLIAGHGRVAAAKVLGLETVPVIRLADLTETHVNALRIADNSLALNAGWDIDTLKVELDALREADFDIDILGLADLEIEGLDFEELPPPLRRWKTSRRHPKTSSTDASVATFGS